jgi:type III secretion protein Q
MKLHYPVMTHKVVARPLRKRARTHHEPAHAPDCSPLLPDLPALTPGLVPALNQFSRRRAPLEVAGVAITLAAATTDDLPAAGHAQDASLDVSLALDGGTTTLRVRTAELARLCDSYGDGAGILADADLAPLVLAAALEPLCTAIRQRWGLMLHRPTLAPAGEQAPAAWLVASLTGGVEHRCPLGVDATLLQALAGAMAGDPALPARCTAPALLQVVIGRCRAPWRELATLRPGDVVVADNDTAGDGTLLVLLGRHWGLHARPEDHGLIALSGFRRMPDAGDCATPPAAMESLSMQDSPLDHLDLPVTFELHRCLVPAQELASITAGHVFELPAKAGGMVDIVVNGQSIGRGELVRIGDRLGVRALRVFGHEQ